MQTNNTAKQKALISFSGGETSAYMLYWLLENKSQEFDFQIVFANTGCENNQTLDFVQKCGTYFNCRVTWVERTFDSQKFKITDYHNATRLDDWKNGQNPLELATIKYGLPNSERLYTTRELKLNPITYYLRSIGWKRNSYYTMIGIRTDEIDRISMHRNANKIIYPLIKYHPTAKYDINLFWKQQPFRLKLKPHYGNCIGCYKKSLKKLADIYKNNPEKLEFFQYLEQKYSRYIPQSRIDLYKRIGKQIPPPPYTMYRGGKTLKQYCQTSKSLYLENMFPDDDEESCEIYTQCGTDN